MTDPCPKFHFERQLPKITFCINGFLDEKLQAEALVGRVLEGYICKEVKMESLGRRRS